MGWHEYSGLLCHDKSIATSMERLYDVLRNEMQAGQHSALDGRNPFSIRLLVL